MTVTVRHHTLRCLLILFIAAHTACDSSCKRPKPTSDNTPPVIKWSVTKLADNSITEFVGNANFQLKPGESVRVTMKAEDPEGVSFIKLTGGYTTECRTPGGPASNASGAFGTDQQTLTPDASGNVLTTAFLIKTIEPATTCPNNLNFVKTTVALTGTGRNYFGGETNATLGINVVP